MKMIIFALALVLLAGNVAALSFQPCTDIMTYNSDGEYVKIFGPGNFWYDDGQFPNPVYIRNGTAYIGGHNA